MSFFEFFPKGNILLVRQSRSIVRPKDMFHSLVIEHMKVPNVKHVINILGKSYDAIRDHEARRDDENSLFWFTYRYDFPEIVPYRITTDAGWGCMLRSAQMMLAQTLRMHYKNRQWVPSRSFAQRRTDMFTVKLMSWFADYPSKAECTFSLHNMVATGLTKHETLPGEWYGPSKVSYVIRDLCMMHAELQAKVKLSPNSEMNRPMFRVHVVSQGTIYRDEILSLMTKNQDQSILVEQHDLVLVSHPLDPIYLAMDEANIRRSLPWDTSLLLLIPLRLGLQSLNQDYTLSLAHMFSLRQSVGVLGGRPRGARWFYGANSDGSMLYGLDPHTIQPCPEKRKVKLPNGQIRHVISLTTEYLSSVHTTNQESITFNRLDPSLSLGFYCRDENDFDNLLGEFQKWKKLNPNVPEMFTVADKVPDYSTNVPNAMKSMLSMSLTEDIDEIKDGIANDDDYVFL